jgi:hypothetical protein
MEKCWASELGDCDNKLSREHIVSQGLFINDKIRVQGFAWCKNEPKEIGLSSLTSKILCRHHNSALSPVDSGGAKAFEAFRESQRLSNVRDKMKSRMWKVKRYKIDGLLLERWFLKTLINSSYGCEYPIGASHSKQGKPSSELVKIAFGKESFKGRAGLYTIARVGQKINSKDTLAFAPLNKVNKYVGGGLFAFRGFLFLLFLLPEGPPIPLTDIYFEDENLGSSQLNFHNLQINMEQGKYLSQVIEFIW